MNAPVPSLACVAWAVDAARAHGWHVSRVGGAVRVEHERGRVYHSSRATFVGYVIEAIATRVANDNSHPWSAR